MVIALIAECGAEVAVWRADDLDRADLAVVDALARLHLAARRRGCSIRLRGAGEELCGLLGVVGLVGVLARELGGEAEGREQLGVEEVVEPGDPSV